MQALAAQEQLASQQMLPATAHHNDDDAISVHNFMVGYSTHRTSGSPGRIPKAGNTEVLSVLRPMRGTVEGITCSDLWGASSTSHVQVPLDLKDAVIVAPVAGHVTGK